MLSASKLNEASATTTAPWQGATMGTPRKSVENEHEYLRRFVDPVLMPLIESLLLYQPERIYEFIHDYVDEQKSARFTRQPPRVGYAKKLTNRRKMVDFMSTSVIPVMDDLAHQILREKPSSVQRFIQDIVAARIIVGSSITISDSNQYEEDVEYHVNDRVLCRYKGRPRYYPGVIQAIDPATDVFTVLYNDGKCEHNVHRMCLKPAPSDDDANQQDSNNNNHSNHTAATAKSPRLSNAKTPTKPVNNANPNTEHVTTTQSVEMVILIIGIDGAGKTTLLSTLQGDLEKEHVPSAGFTSISFQTETGTATFYDLGGGPAFRDVWKEYYADAHGVMFVMDSSNEKIVQQSARILCETMANPLMERKPLLIFANKRDQPSAVSEDDLTQILQLKELPLARLIPCVAKPSANGSVVDDRLEVGLHWLFDQVNRNFDTLHVRVQSDTEKKKQLDDQRRTEQRMRVAKWKEEREQSQMVLHDKYSMVPVVDQPTSSKAKAETPEEDVIYCTHCSVQPAVTKCSASKWMPVCAVCVAVLKSNQQQ